MKGLLIFALAFASLSAAHAGENVQPDSPRAIAEVEGARSVDPVSPPRSQPSAALSIPAAPLAGNPLQAVPLSALSETRNRPLFIVTRRPPPANLISQPTPEAVVHDQPPEPEQQPFALVGTILSSNASIAVLLDRATNRVTQLRQGKNEFWLDRAERRPPLDRIAEGRAAQDRGVSGPEPRVGADDHPR